MTPTKWFILIALTAIIGWDVSVLILRGYQETISATLYAGAKDFPIIPFALGVVFGHLFWPPSHV